MRTTLSLNFLFSSLLFSPLTTSTPVNSTLLIREIKSGEKSTLSITTFIEHGCQGRKYEYSNAIYGTNPADPTDTLLAIDGLLSYHLSRHLDPSEQLDFSTDGTTFEVINGYRGDQLTSCAKYLESAATASKAGCYDTKSTATCFRLWHH